MTRETGLISSWPPLVCRLRAAAVLTLAGMLAAATPASPAEPMRSIPPPAVNVAAGASKSETAVLAGGCFWGVQGVFQHVKGVTNAVSGYAGGAKATAVYDKVGSGRTGHAEAVQVTYDPSQISFGQILQIYFSVGHDPTQLNRQGPDVGPQYRSAIFPRDSEQLRVAKAYIAQLDATGAFPAPIVTTLETERSFYPAEANHQDFMFHNPDYPYIVTNDQPKIEGLKRILPRFYRAKPVLVGDNPPSN